MVSSIPQPIAPITPTTDLPLATTKPAEQRVVFRHLSWENYQQILAALGNKRSSRLTFDRGTLEITMPLEQHENALRLIEVFIRVLAEEFDFTLKTMGSTTLSRPDLARSAEPDDCYYIQNQPKVANKIVDLSVDPPPDLIVEVDITHTDIDKLNLYANMGVPEFWRYNGRVLRIYQLQDNQYVEVENSPTFSLEIKDRLYQFLRECQQNESRPSKELRAWASQQKKG